MTAIADLDERTREKLEAAAFRALVEHLRAHPEVQNTDLMNLAGFCRNCLSKWYRAAAEERGLHLSDEQAREVVYGMPYDEWKAKHQTEATREQQKKLTEPRRRTLDLEVVTPTIRRPCERGVDRSLLALAVHSRGTPPADWPRQTS
jgi:hypothetical protein